MAFRAAVVSLFVLTGLFPQSSAACGPGTFSPGGGVCIPCPPGTWQDQSNASTCKEAQPGYSARGPGAASQTPCPPGYYSTGLASSCTICPAGTHCNGNSNTQPTQCSPGSYSSKPGASQDCTPCPAGTFTAINGATSCCQCCSGWYNDQTGQTHCFQCPNEGSFHQGYSPAGSTSASDCRAASGAASSCSQTAYACPLTGGVSPSRGAQKRSPPRRQTVTCTRGHTKCPVFGMLYGAGYTRAYECVDTQNDLEACGGCVDGDSWNGERGGAGGRDCSAIPNVDSVRCVKGECVIERCKEGYAVSHQGTKCRPLFVPSNQW